MRFEEEIDGVVLCCIVGGGWCGFLLDFFDGLFVFGYIFS